MVDGPSTSTVGASEPGIMSGNPEPSVAGAVATPDVSDELPTTSGVRTPVPAKTSRRAALVAQVKRLVAAIREGDEQTVESAVLALSQSRRIFAPLAFIVGGSSCCSTA